MTEQVTGDRSTHVCSVAGMPSESVCTSYKRSGALDRGPL